MAGGGEVRTINQHVKLLRTGNMYSIDDPNDLPNELARALIHYAKKHDLEPVRIIVHPDTLQGYEGDMEIVSRDNGTIYRATIEAHATVGAKTFMITNGGE